MTPNSTTGPDNMDVDALTTEQNRRTEDKLLRVRAVLVTWPKIVGSRKRTTAVVPTTWVRKGKAKGRKACTKSLRRCQRRLHQWEPQPVNSRINQGTDTWDRPVPMDEDEDESCETGYILGPSRHRETFHQSKDWYVVHDSERTIICKSSTLSHRNVHVCSSPSQQSKP